MHEKYDMYNNTFLLETNAAKCSGCTIPFFVLDGITACCCCQDKSRIRALSTLPFVATRARSARLRSNPIPNNCSSSS